MSLNEFMKDKRRGMWTSGFFSKAGDIRKHEGLKN